MIGTRTSGRGGKVLSDGEQTRVATVVKHPPSVVFNLDEDSVPEPRELWFWDVRGYLVLRGVMDEDWLAAANRAIEATLEDQTHPAAIEEVPEQALRENDWVWPDDTSPRL